MGAGWPCLPVPNVSMNTRRVCYGDKASLVSPFRMFRWKPGGFVMETRHALSLQFNASGGCQPGCYVDKACLVSTIQCIRWKPAGFVVETRSALSPRSECFDEYQAGLLWRQGQPCLYKTVCSFYAGRCPALSAARPLALEGVCLIYLVEGKLFFSSGIFIHQLAGGELRHRVGFGHVSTHCHDVYLREGGLDE